MSGVMNDLGSAVMFGGLVFAAMLILRLPAIALAKRRKVSQQRLLSAPLIVLSLLVGVTTFVSARSYRACDLGPDTCAWANLSWAMGIPLLIIIYGVSALIWAWMAPSEKPSEPAVPTQPQ